MSSHHKEEIWSLNRQLMACHLSDGKSPAFITLCSTARKRNTKLAEGEREGEKEGRACFLPVSLHGWLPGLLPAQIGQENPLYVHLPPWRQQKCFPLLFSHYSEFLLRKLLTFIKESLRLVEVLLFLLIFASAAAPAVNKDQIALLFLSSSRVSPYGGFECLTASSALWLPSSSLLLLSSRYFW